jgi:hypothetical protein
MAAKDAAKVAADWDGDVKSLPANVRAAVLDVEKTVDSLEKRVEMAEALYDVDPGHELALEPGKHGQSTAAYRFEEVGGEIVEVRKDSGRSKTRIIHRPDLVAASKPDPASAITALLRGDEPSDDE